MNTEPSRRDLLAASFAAATLGVVQLGRASAQESGVHREFPSQDSVRVQRFVGVCHSSLESVKTMLAETPELAKSAWDLGFGDWETALGAASHTGQKEIALLLIEHGARPDLFTHAMLDHLAVVEAAIASQPSLLRVHGPHGIPLIAHARAGEAQEVIAFLEKQGLEPVKRESALEAERSSLVGSYRFGPGEDEILEIGTNRQGLLTLARKGRSARNLWRVGEGEFSPAGAPRVRVRFTLEQGEATSLSIHEPHPSVIARRVPSI